MAAAARRAKERLPKNVWPTSVSNNAASDGFVFPSARGTALESDNFLFRVFKEA